jgi:hypothetical protein
MLLSDDPTRNAACDSYPFFTHPGRRVAPSPPAAKSGVTSISSSRIRRCSIVAVMAPRGHPRLLWFILLALFCACSSKKELDAVADRVVATLQRNDRQAFNAIAHADLRSKEKPGAFTAFAAAFERLGAYKGKSMTWIGVESGGIRKATYVLSFAKGDVMMKLTLKEGKVHYMAFQGRSLIQRLQLVTGTPSGALRVQSFRWLHEGKGERGSYRPGEPIRFELKLSGLRRDSEGILVRVGLSAISDVGTVVVDNPTYAEVKSKSTAATTVVPGELKLPEPGNYRIELAITDMKSRATLDHAQPLTVEPKK